MKWPSNRAGTAKDDGDSNTKKGTKMKKLGNKGFSHVEALIIVIVLVLIGGVGYSVYKRSSNGGSDSISTAEAEGCGVAAQNNEKLAIFYSKNKATFLKEWGKKNEHLWKLGAGPIDGIAAKYKGTKGDMTLLYRNETFPYRYGGLLKGACAVEKKCGDIANTDGSINTIEVCRNKQRIKQSVAEFAGLKTINDDKRAVRIKACRDSDNPAKPIRFGEFNTYEKAKQIVAAYEKKNNIKFAAKPNPGGFTKEQWQYYTEGSFKGTDHDRALEAVQRALTDAGPDAVNSQTPRIRAYLKFNPGKSRTRYIGKEGYPEKTKNASLAYVHNGESIVNFDLVWGTAGPAGGVKELITSYNKIEGYYKANNGNETNPIVYFEGLKGGGEPQMGHEDNWTGTHPYISTKAGTAKEVPYKFGVRFKTLAKCPKNMYPATLYEMAKQEGWDS